MLFSTLVVSLAVASPRSDKLVFRHSWDTLPVFWFSANASGPESSAEMALISNYSAAVLSWELGTQAVDDPWRHTDNKMRALAAKLGTAAPKTEVIMYMQSQLAMVQTAAAPSRTSGCSTTQHTDPRPGRRHTAAYATP
jgi:hypothetical protein